MDHGFECRLNETDLLRFHLYYWEHSAVGGRHRQQKRILGLVLYLAAAVLMYECRQYVVANIFVAFAAAWYLFWPSYVRQRTQAFYVSHVRETADELLREPHVVTLSPEGICSSTALGRTVSRYSAVDRVVENDGYTYVFIGKTQGLILPHDRLPKEAIDSFVAEIERRRATASGPAKDGSDEAS